MAEPRGMDGFVLRDLLLRNGDLWPARPAVICDGAELSWAELIDRTHRAAAWLAGLGVDRGDRVLLLTDNRPEVVELAFALAELGAVLVPVSPAIAGPELGYVWSDSGARLGLAPRELIPEGEGSGPWIEIGDEAYAAAVGSGPVEEPALGERAEDPVLQLYTSGTTGRPKGVVLSQGGMHLHGLTTVASQGLTEEDAFLTCTPITHAAGATRIFSLPTLGIPQVLMRRWDSGEFLAAIGRHGVTTTVLVPSMMRDVVADPRLGDADLSTLRLLVYGAAPIEPDLLAECLERLPCGLLHSYGMSEACTALTALTPEEHERFHAAGDDRLRSVGRPVPGVRCRIVDDAGRPLPTGEVGEVELRSCKQMLGYWRRPAEDAEIWRRGWLVTGDRGYVDDAGYLFLVGRRKEMIISGGINVYPAEVEAALAGHPAVREAVVVGRPHPRWGETPVAFVVPAAPVDERELLDFCRSQLSRYKVPTAVREIETLPRNALGKVLRRELEALAERENPLS